MTQAQQKIQGKFYPLQTEEWLRACTELKAAERDVLFYLRTLDPFGDRKLEVTVSEIATTLGRHKGTISRALQRLDQKKWIDLEFIKVKFKLLTRCVEATPEKTNTVAATQPELCTDNAGCVQTTPVAPTQQPDFETQSGQELQRAKTIKKLNTLSDGTEREKKTTTDEKGNSQIASQDVFNRGTEVVADISINNDESIKNSLSLAEVELDHQIAPRHTTNKKQNVISNWLPDGPWKVDEKLDPHFRDFVAKDWVNRYGGTLHQRRADVLAHFKKEPANLPIRWEQYATEYLHRYQNTQMRINNGASIEEEYQQRLITNHRAVSQPLTQDLSPVGRQQVGSPSQLKPLSQIASSDEWQNLIPPGAENPQAYKPYTPVEVVEEERIIEDTEALAKGKELIAQIRAKIAQKFNIPQAQPTPLEKDKEMTKLERLNEWISDPTLRREIEHKLIDYHVERDEEGIPYRVSELSF